MRAKLAALVAVCLAACVVVSAVPAIADEADEPLRLDFGRARDNPALEQWHSDRGWHYSTDYLFGTTRGLRDAGVRPMLRPLVWLVTVPFDIANLPIAAAAGLFGD